MTRRGIVIWPDPRLSTHCAPVKQVGDEIRHLAKDMLDTMYAAPGRGLAAPQIGVMLRVFVMDATWKEGARDPQVFINPEILDTSESTATCAEGCLSIPGVSAEVTRPESLRLAWLDETGARREQKFEGFAAACVQHEIDHLNGVVTLDHLDDATRAQVLMSYREITA